ncbi:MAG: hypothetical protein AAGU16_07195 [Desulfitobacterium hafniense]
MSDYKKMYFALFNSVTTAINQLQKAQQEGENTYIESGDVPFTVLQNHPEEKQEESDIILRPSAVEGKVKKVQGRFFRLHSHRFKQKYRPLAYTPSAHTTG